MRLGIVVGLFIIYSLSYHALAKTFNIAATTFVVIPVIAASWLYGIQGGVITSLFSTLLNVILLGALTANPNWDSWLSNRNIGDFFSLILVSLIVGYLSRNVENRIKAEAELRSREQYLETLNEMTRAILARQDLDSTLGVLSSTMAKLFNADDWYITRWDPVQKEAIPFVTSEKMKLSYSAMHSPGETNMTESVLALGHALAVSDTFSSPYLSPIIARKFPVRSVLGVPLIVGKHELGAVLIAFNTQHEFTQEEIARAEHTGAQIALALWNAQQDDEIAHRLKEMNALVKIGSALGESEHTGINIILQLIVNSARELIPNAEQSIIHLLDDEEEILIPQAVSGYSKNKKKGSPINMPLGKGVAGQVIQKGSTINIPEVHTDRRFLGLEKKPPYHSMLVAPIESRKQRIGTITILSHKTHAFSPNEVKLIKVLGTQAAIAIENSRLFETTQRRFKEIDVLYRISRGMAISLDINSLFKEVTELLDHNFKYYNTQIFLINLVNSEIIRKCSSGNNAEMVQQSGPIQMGIGIVGHVAATGEPFMTNHVEQVAFFKQNLFLADIQSELAVPIKIENQVVGVLDIQEKPPHKLNENDLQLITAIADQLAVMMQEVNLYVNLQESLNQEKAMRSQLVQSERLALVGRLLASVSHELNNPLQAIQNALFLIKEEANLSMQSHEDLQIILSETERMAALIERLRSTYRPIRAEEFHFLQLNNLIEEVYTLISTHMRHNKISFEFHPDPDLPPIPGLSDQLRQVMLNLFLNAAEAMTSGGRLIVETRNMPADNGIILAIQDSGPGIDPELLPQIFNPFVTDKATGTGLGLTITHDIIEQHSGWIQAENISHGGALFTVWLPAQKKD